MTTINNAPGHESVGALVAGIIDQFFNDNLGIMQSLLSAIGAEEVDYDLLDGLLDLLRSKIVKALSSGDSVDVGRVDTGKCRIEIRGHLLKSWDGSGQWSVHGGLRAASPRCARRSLSTWRLV